MKTTLEIIDRLPVGSVVPKTILARMKRAGVIDSYSLWGYLTIKLIKISKPEQCRIRSMETLPEIPILLTYMHDMQRNGELYLQD